MTAPLHLRQLALRPAAGPFVDEKLSGTLVVRGEQALHAVPIEDVIALLIALATDHTYAAYGHLIQGNSLPGGRAELVLTAGANVTSIEMGHAELVGHVIALVKAVAIELRGRGAAHLVAPLRDALGAIA